MPLFRTTPGHKLMYVLGPKITSYLSAYKGDLSLVEKGPITFHLEGEAVKSHRVLAKRRDLLLTLRAHLKDEFYDRILK